MVFRLQLTYNEILDILGFKYVPTKRSGYSLNPGVYEIIDLNNTLKYILPDNVKVTVTIDDIRLKLNLKINRTLIFTEKSFFYTILGYTRSRSYPLGDIDGFYQLIAGSYTSDRPINCLSGCGLVGVSLEAVLACIVKCGKCMRPCVVSMTTLLFLIKCNPIIGPVSFFITTKCSAKELSPISNITVAVDTGFSNWPLATCI